MKVDKTKYKDEKGRFIVQGLFLEDRYNVDLAVFTFDGEDKVYKGKTYPSLKKLYLEFSDPVEYNFAREYLYDWPHWKRLCKNSVVSKHIEGWREELVLKLMADGVELMVELAEDKGSYQAAKFLTDKGWDKGERGRPSNDKVEGELQRRADEAAEWEDDFNRVIEFKKDK